MEILKQRILKDGKVKEGNVLKVDSFLNHQMDIRLLDEIGREFRRRFAGEEINKILTIEASGIGMASPPHHTLTMLRSFLLKKASRRIWMGSCTPRRSPPSPEEPPLMCRFPKNISTRVTAC